MELTLNDIRDIIYETLQVRLAEDGDIHIVEKTNELIVLGSEMKDTLLTLNPYGIFKALVQTEELRGAPLDKDYVEQYVDRELFRAVETWYVEEHPPVLSMEIQVILDSPE